MTAIGKTTVPLKEILSAYGWQKHSCSTLSGGLINQTYLVLDAKTRPVAVLQKLHRIFDSSVNLDIENISQHLIKEKISTPLLIRTLDNKVSAEYQSDIWRALTYMEGDTYHTTPSLVHARSAGEHIGRFHKALSELNYNFIFKRSGVHDTPKHLATLANKIGSQQNSWSAQADDLASKIIEKSSHLPPLPESLPKRICHGDLKISNLLFKKNTSKALCLVDLDTMGKQTLAYELGDALRSWCKVTSEDNLEGKPNFEIASSLLKGFASVMAEFISAEEIQSIAIGFETICLELAARFCIDIYEDNYFGWNEQLFPSRRKHNFIRCKAQFENSLYLGQNRTELLQLCKECFKSF